MEIGEPTVLSRLPRAGLTGDGHTQFCQVYGLRHGQRKKRQEICAAVDGNSLNVFEVVNGRNVASWPVSPDTTFVCAPVSERLLLADGTFMRRSWSVVRRQTGLFAQYFEESQKSSQVAQHSSKSYKLSHDTNILRIDTAPPATDGALVTYGDGTISHLSTSGEPDAKTTATYQGTGVVLQQSCWLTIEEASSTVLKSRQDLLSKCAPSSALLVTVCSVTGSKHPHLAYWEVSCSTPESSIEPLFCHSLSGLGLPKAAAFEFSANCKQLKAIGAPHTTVVDLTTIVPQRLYTQRSLPSEQKAALALTAEVDAYLSSGELRIFNHKFSSLLASRRIDEASLKRKRDGSNGPPLVPIAYFSQISRILASTPTQLVAIDLSSTSGISGDLKRSSMLINNILRGVPGAEPAVLTSVEYTTSIGRNKTGKTIPDWPLLLGDLENLASQNDVNGFVSRFTDAFHVHGAQGLKNFKYGQDKLDFLLNIMFAYDRSDTTSHRLSIQFMAPELLRWTMAAGLLDDHRVAHAVGIVPGTMSLTGVAQAIINADTPEASLLEAYIRHSPYLEAETLTFIVTHLISRIRSNSENVSNATTQLANGNQSPVMASLELTQPSAATTSASKPVTTCLILALQRLAYTGTKSVSAQLSSSSMQQADIISLVQFLRQQLFQGGFYRMGGSANYPSPAASQVGDEASDEKTGQQLSLEAIVCLIDGCVDAIGPVGVLGASEDEAFLRAMVTELCSEIASTSEAVQDSVALQGLVRETLRYVESVERQSFEVRKKVEQPTEGRTAVKGEIVTLYAEHNTEESGLQFGTSLPLSLKAEESDITSHKTRRGGQTQRRSTREIGMLKDRLKAPYSFERLVL